MVEYDDLLVKERRAIERLRRLARAWPKTLALFSNSGTLEVHKNVDDEPYTDETFIDDVHGIANDGGDRN